MQRISLPSVRQKGNENKTPDQHDDGCFDDSREGEGFFRIEARFEKKKQREDRHGKEVNENKSGNEPPLRRQRRGRHDDRNQSENEKTRAEYEIAKQQFMPFVHII